MKGNEGQELGDADEQDQVGDGEDSLPPTSSGRRRRNPPGVSHYYGFKDYSRKIKNSGWAMLSITIELGERFKTSRAVLKVLTTLSRLFSNASWLSSSPIVTTA